MEQQQQIENLRTDAKQLFERIGAAMDDNDGVLATQLYHKLEGVRAAAHLLRFVGLDLYIGDLMTRLRVKNREWLVE